MGAQWQCSSCDFEFSSGHAHQTGSAQCLCLACGQLYLLVSQSSWGPADGERVELRRPPRRPKTRGPGRHRNPARSSPEGAQAALPGEPTGQFLAFHRAPDSAALEADTQSLSCPGCQAIGTVALSLAPGQACPRCRQGVLSGSFVLY